LSLTSDFIVGFPGETDADFASTLKLIEDIRFDGAFSFIYSPRPGTPAAALPDPVPPEVAQERLARLQSAVDALYQSYGEAMVGSRQRVLVTGPATRHAGDLQARTDNNRVVNFPGDAELINNYVDVAIVAAQAHSLRGELVTL
jgi:tRNA-2-methylthio-N6-dimethylallyladenosine synthase